MVRAPLCLATLVASRSNPVLDAVYQRLLANAKPPKLALVVLMRKMLITLNVIWMGPPLPPAFLRRRDSHGHMDPPNHRSPTFG